jgi:hypothetical protein
MRGADLVNKSPPPFMSMSSLGAENPGQTRSKIERGRSRADTLDGNQINVTRVLITGGPCAGKTTFMASMS